MLARRETHGKQFKDITAAHDTPQVGRQNCKYLLFLDITRAL